MAAQALARGLPRQGAGDDAAARRRGGPRARPSEAGQLTYRYEDRGAERTASFPADPKDDVTGAVASASSGPLRDYQDKLKAITLRERGMEKAEIAAKLGRSEHWVKRWWREHPATLERPAGAKDVVLQKASMHSFRDLDIRRSFAEDGSLFESLKEQVVWRQAKVVSRDQNTGELALRYDEKGRSIRAGRQVSDYTGGLDFLDKLLQKVFSEMDIRDPQARIFMNYYADGKERTGVHRHDFWTCLLSFGANRILTVDGRPLLLRDGDLVVFGTQNHGVPVMPEITDGRISLVIFFYPDSDNLERQWKTITDDVEQDEEAPRAAGPASQLHVGVDRDFNAALLWSGAPPAGQGGGCAGHAPAAGSSAQGAALAGALDPGAQRRSLLKSPNSSLQFADGGSSASQSRAAVAAEPTVFSVCCDEGASDARAAEKQLFRQLEVHGARALWDLRARPLRGSWSEPESMRRACAARAVGYRHYPLGRREAGGAAGHTRSEEGQDVLRRLLAAAAREPAAFLTGLEEADFRRPGTLRSEVAACLAGGQLGQAVLVQHVTPDGLERHPSGAAAAPAAAPLPPPAASAAPAQREAGAGAAGAHVAAPQPPPASPAPSRQEAVAATVPAAPAADARPNRWGRRRAAAAAA